MIIITVIRAAKTGRGLAVTFADESVAQAAMQSMNGHVLGDRNIRSAKTRLLTKTPKSSKGAAQRPTNLPEAEEGCRCYVGNWRRRTNKA